MRFLHPESDQNLELSIDDVFLVPQYFDGHSRMDVSLSPSDFKGSSNPIVSANMNAVTGKRMAETMARCGGLGILPQDMDLGTVRRIVRHVKKCDPRYDTALTVDPDATLRDVQGLIRKRSHDLVVVLGEESRPIGVVTRSDLRDRDQYTPVHQLMSTDMVIFKAGIENREAYLRLLDARVHAAPVVDDNGSLIGILTRNDAVRLELLKPSLTSRQQLQIAAAVGISAHAADQAEALLEAGIDALVLDTAHGHQRRMLEAIKSVRARVGPDVVIAAGNVCTIEGTRALVEAGADIIKVNVGPGAMCTTRMQTGVGRPTFTSVYLCAQEARRLGKHVWADGGVKHPRDVSVYLAAGASRVMLGTMLAGTHESPGDIKEDRDGHLYKENYGMASARAVLDRTTHLDPFDRAQKAFFKEGISNSKIYFRPGYESVSDILIEIITGLQSALTYTGASGLNDFHEKAIVGVQSRFGYGEGRPHGRVRNKD